MPTGYTAIIDDSDATFEQYVWRCARAFGALMHMRDDDLCATVRPPPEDDWHAKELAKCEARMLELNSMTSEQVATMTELANDAEQVTWQKWDAAEREMTARYERMHDRIMGWECPTPCAELKKFMLDQLVVSRKYSGAPERPMPKTARDWFAHEVSSTARSIAYHREHMVKAARRRAECVEWLEALQKSVPYARQPERE